MSGSNIAGFDNIMSIDYRMASARAEQFKRERDEALSKLDDVTRKDLDETRRLLYAALAAGRTKKYTLVGTLTNALVHHSHLETDAVATIDRFVALIEDNLAGAWDETLALIAEVTARLEQPAEADD